MKTLFNALLALSVIAFVIVVLNLAFSLISSPSDVDFVVGLGIVFLGIGAAFAGAQHLLGKLLLLARKALKNYEK